MTENVQANTQTQAIPSGKEVYLPPEPALYFHPETGELFYLDVDENAEIEEEDAFLSALIKERIAKGIEYLKVSSSLKNEAISEPLNHIEIRIQQAKDELNKAVEALEKELESLTKIHPDEEVKLYDDSEKDRAIRMVELIKVKKHWGKKYTYVRSDKIKNHWRKYKLNKKDYLVFKGMTPQDSSSTDKRKKPTRIDEDKFKSAMKEAINQIKESGVNLKLWEKQWPGDSGVLGDWAKDINEKLKFKKNKNPDEPSQIDFSAEAQLMRYSYGAGTVGEYNPFVLNDLSEAKGEISAGFNFYANFDVCAAQAKGSVYIPDEKGLEITYPNKNGETSSLGHFRFQIEAKLYGSVGASGAIHLNVKIGTDGIMGTKGDPQTERLGFPGNKKVDLKKVRDQSGLDAELGVFVGVEAGGNIAGTFGWKNPELQEDFTDLAKIVVGKSVMAGVGAKGALRFTLIDNKLRILVKAALCWGVGAKGEFACEMDLNTIMTQFLPCFTYMLRNVDYIEVAEIMDAEDFAALCALVILLPNPALLGTAVLSFNFGEDIINKLTRLYDQAEFRLQLMDQINQSPDFLKYSPPESKGSLIAMLLEKSFWDIFWLRGKTHEQQECENKMEDSYSGRKMAILKCFRWVQSKRDYENVLQHISLIPGETKTSDWRQNETKIIEFLKKGEFSYRNNNPRSRDYLTDVYNSTYHVSFKKIYASLPDSIDDPLAVLKPISDEIFSGCAQTINPFSGIKWI
ncbi:hypothetical protein [Thorsellia kenyensis]|uniref:Uncharacterized protein n=1 Tax=Thorsellia kenyensis TaxID=1549888 RepID=A0ABV6CAD7_9GAMM